MDAPQPVAELELTDARELAAFAGTARTGRDPPGPVDVASGPSRRRPARPGAPRGRTPRAVEDPTGRRRAAQAPTSAQAEAVVPPPLRRCATTPTTVRLPRRTRSCVPRAGAASGRTGARDRRRRPPGCREGSRPRSASSARRPPGPSAVRATDGHARSARPGQNRPDGDDDQGCARDQRIGAMERDGEQGPATARTKARMCAHVGPQPGSNGWRSEPVDMSDPFAGRGPGPSRGPCPPRCAP